MSSKGWIKLHRRIKDHWLFQEERKFSRFEAWIDLLMKANHAENKFLLGNELVEVKRGQLVTSELKLMQTWGWGKSKTREFLNLLEQDGMIVKESDRKKTTLTICNYGVYHDEKEQNRPQTDHEQTASRPQADTNKNEKNDKNEKKKERHRFSTSDMSLAELLFSNIRENNPGFKKPNLDKWANDIRLMRERDERTEEQIEYLINWTQQHEFWQSNILSPEKLRKQFDKLIMQVKNDKKQSNVVDMRIGYDPERDAF